MGKSDQLVLAQKIVKENMSVRDLEGFLKDGVDINKKILYKKNLKSKDANIVDYEKYLSLKLGYKVEIKDKEGKGYLLVRYKNLEQLDAIVELFNN